MTTVENKHIWKYGHRYIHAHHSVKDSVSLSLMLAQILSLKGGHISCPIFEDS